MATNNTIQKIMVSIAYGLGLVSAVALSGRIPVGATYGGAYNGLVLTYSITGVASRPAVETGDFVWGYEYEGRLTGKTLTFSGTLSCIIPGHHVDANFSAGTNSFSLNYQPTPFEIPFSITVTCPTNAQGSVSLGAGITLIPTGSGGFYDPRGLYVRGLFNRTNPAVSPFFVVDSDPQNNAQNVNYQRPIIVNFSDEIDAGSVNAGTISAAYTSYGRENIPVAAQVTGRRAAINLPLSPHGRRVRVVLRGGANGIQSYAGKPLDKDYSLSFTTLPELTVRVIPVQTVDDTTLVRNKPGVTRIKAEWAPPGTATDVKTLTADVAVRYDGQAQFTRRAFTFNHEELPASPIASGPSYNPGRIYSYMRRGNSANFYSQNQEMPIVQQAGAHQIIGRVTPAGQRGTPVVFETNRTVNVNAWIQPALSDFEGFRTLYVPLNVGGWTAGETRPINAYAQRVDQYLRRLFPTPNVSTTSYDEVWDVHAGDPPAREALWLSWVNGIAANLSRYRNYNYDVIIGVVPDAWLTRYAGAVGLAGSSIVSLRSALASYNSQPTAIVHEVGHTVGRTGLWHNSGPINMFGYDVEGDRWINSFYPEITDIQMELMDANIAGPAPNTVWIGRDNYQFLLDYYTRAGGAGLAKPRSGPLSPSSASSAKYLNLQGQLSIPPSQAETAQVNWVQFQDSGWYSPSLPGGTHSIDLQNAGGSLIGRYEFTPVYVTNSDGQQYSAFCASLPCPDEVARVNVRSGSTLLAQVARSSQAPVVTIIVPATPRIVSGPLNVRWNASDADGDRLAYDVLFQSHPEQPWESLAVGLTNSVYALDTTKLPNTTQGQLKVVALDGFNTASAASAVFTILNAPTAWLVYPAQGATKVELEPAIQFQFRDPMNTNTVVRSSFRLADAQGQDIPMQVEYDAVRQAALLKPFKPLNPGTVYTVAAATNLCGSAGLFLAAPVVASFTTVPDVHGPALVSTFPADQESEVPLDQAVMMVFSKPVQAQSFGPEVFRLEDGMGNRLPGEYGYDAGSATAWFKPLAALRIDAIYTGFLNTNLLDLAGNRLAANQSWSFRTGTEPSFGVRVLGQYNQELIDTTGSGLGNYLVVQMEIEVSTTGNYTLRGALAGTNGLRVAQSLVTTNRLTPGAHTVALMFETAGLAALSGSDSLLGLVDVSIKDLAQPVRYLWLAETPFTFNLNSNLRSAVVSVTSPANGAVFTAPAQVAIQVAALDPTWSLAKVEFFHGDGKIQELTEAPFEIAWPNLAAGTYVFKVRATDYRGVAFTLPPVAITVTAPQTLDSPWKNRDLGNPTIAGQAGPNQGQWTIQGSGVDLGGAVDNCHFVYQRLTGDCEIIARLGKLDGGHPWSSAGLMFRENLSPAARQALMAVSRSGGTLFQWRPVAGNPCTATLPNDAATTPIWLKLSRIGNRLTGYKSVNGQDWTMVDSAPMTLPDSGYVGLAVFAHNAELPALAVFDQVSTTDLRLGAPIITRPLASQTGEPGRQISWKITATGAGPLVYRWFRNGAPLADDGRIQGASTPQLSLSNLQLADAGSYAVAVSNAVGWTMSSPAPLTGFLRREEYLDVPGNSVADLIGHAQFLLHRPGATTALAQFQTPGHPATDYGQCVQGFIVAPESGSYIFYLAAQGAAALWLSLDDTPANKILAATVPAATGPNDWTQYGSQKSGVVNMQAGKKYYVEAVMKGAVGENQLAVAWALPSSPSHITVVPGTCLGTEDYPARLAPELVKFPQSQTNMLGARTGFDVSAVGSSPLKYQWRFKATNNLADDLRIHGAHTASLLIDNSQTTDVGDYQAVVENGAGSIVSPAASLKLLPASPLATPWQHQDIGKVGLAGFSAYSEYAGGVFTVGGSGADATEAMAGYRYLYQSWTGDGDFVARVASFPGSGPRAQVGVMIRESLDPGSRLAAMVMTATQGPSFVRRRVTAGTLVANTPGTPTFIPCWLRLERRANLITGYHSQDGLQWTRIDSINMALPPDLYFGLVVDSGDPGSLQTARFDQVNLGDGSSAAPRIISQPVSQAVAPGSAVSLNATATGMGPLQYQWRCNGTNLVDGGPISGASTPALKISRAQTNHLGIFKLVVSNPYGTVISAAAELGFTNISSLADWEWARPLEAAGTFPYYQTAMDADGSLWFAVSFQNALHYHNLSLTNQGAQELCVFKLAPSGEVVKYWRDIPCQSLTQISLAVDSDYLYVAGSYFPTGNFGAVTLSLPGTFVTKYDKQGEVIWAKRLLQQVNFFSLAVSKQGAIYMAGYLAGQNQFGDQVLYPGNGQFYLLQIDDRGNELWAKQIRADGSFRIYDLAVDESGNALLAGYYGSAVTAVFDHVTLPANDLISTFLAKYSREGQVLWAQRIGAGQGYAVAADRSNNVFLTGMLLGTNTAFGNTVLTNTGSGDFFIAKYDPAGTVIWARQATGRVGQDAGQDLQVDSDGNVWAGGYFTQNADFGGALARSPNGGNDAFLARYDAAGNLNWVRNSSSTAGATGDQVGVDSVGNGFLVGRFRPATTFGSTTLNPPGVALFVARLSSRNGLGILSFPHDRTVSAGSSITLECAASGLGPLSYQWQQNGGNLADGIRFNGATTPSLVIQRAQLADSGSYSIQVRDASGLVANAACQLVVVASNQLPTVTLTSPASQLVLPAPAVLTFSASASDRDGTIQKVEFYSRAIKIGEAKTFPYSYTWRNVPAGRYNLKAKAIDNAGGESVSEFVAVIVNAPPSINLDSPSNNASYYDSAVVPILATATDNEGAVALVEFFANAVKLGERASPPFAFNWTNPPAADYSLTARATDQFGATAVSPAIQVRIMPTPVQQPHYWDPLPIAGRIEVEDFDRGGEGFAYHVQSSGVPLVQSQDENGTLAWDRGRATEWLEYTVDVKQSGSYFAAVRVAAQGQGGKFRLDFDNVAKTTLVTVPDTGGWQNWRTVPTPRFHLGAGRQILRLSLVRGGADGTTVGSFNYLDFQTAAPVVTLASPTNHAVYVITNVIMLAASADVYGGVITNLEFFAGNTSLGQVQTPPYQMFWTNPPEGSYSITARATDNFGVAATSPAVNIQVNPGRRIPFNGDPVPILGSYYERIIEAEQFDRGGEGIATHTLSGIVDIEYCQDISGSSQDVGKLKAGEWLDYSVNVTATGDYDIAARVASPNSNGTFHVEFNGIDKTGPWIVPNTGNWQSWKFIQKPRVPLSAGPQFMRLVLDKAGTDGLTVGSFNFFVLNAALPEPWNHQDLGKVRNYGNAFVARSDQSLAVRAQPNADFPPNYGFHYAFQPFWGDGEIIAQISTIFEPAFGGNVRAGLMISEQLTPDSAHAFAALVAPTGGSVLEIRSSRANMLGDLPGNDGIKAPYWLKLTRQGSFFTAYKSKSGTDWQKVASGYWVNTPYAIYAGLAVRVSRDAGIDCQAFYSNVKVTSAAPAPAPTLSIFRNGPAMNLNLKGTLDKKYDIEYLTDLGRLNNWIFWTNISLSNTLQTLPLLPVDVKTNRFYRAIQKGP